MKIIQGIKKLIYGLKSSWNLGRCEKYSRKGNYDLALKYCKLSHDYSILACASEASIALKEEFVAEILAKMKNYDEALEYAEKSRKVYINYQGKGEIYDEALKRVDNIIAFIDQQKAL